MESEVTTQRKWPLNRLGIRVMSRKPYCTDCKVFDGMGPKDRPNYKLIRTACKPRYTDF